jgi:hypothetical protein
MRKIIADLTPNVASTLNEVQKILLTNGLLTKPLIFKLGNFVHVSSFQFINNGIIVETDDMILSADFPSKFYLYFYTENAAPNSPVKYHISEKDYNYPNMVKVAYYDGEKFNIEDTISPQEIAKYVRGTEKDRGFVSDNLIYCNSYTQITVPKGQIISRFGNFVIDSDTTLSLPPTFLTAGAVNSRISYRLLINSRGSFVFEGINHRKLTTESGTYIRSAAFPSAITAIPDFDYASTKYAVFASNNPYRALMRYDSELNEWYTISDTNDYAPYNSVKCLYEERIFTAKFTYQKIAIRSYPLSLANPSGLIVDVTDLMKDMVINPLTRLIYAYGFSGTNLIIYKFSYDSQYLVNYQKRFTINIQKNISSISAGWSQRNIIIYALTEDNYLYKVTIDEWEGYTVNLLLQVSSYSVKNSIDDDLYIIFNPYNTKDLIILKNNSVFAELKNFFTTTSPSFNNFEIVNNRIYIQFAEGGANYLGEIVKTENGIETNIYSNFPTGWNLCRSGQMLLAYSIGAGYIYQLNTNYLLGDKYLPELLEDNTLAVIYQEIGNYIENYIPATRTNRIKKFESSCLDISKVLEELYEENPHKSIHLKIENGIYIDTPVKIRGDTTLEGTFYLDWGRLGANTVFTKDNISVTALNSLANSYYNLTLNNIALIGPDDHIYSYDTAENLLKEYSIVEQINNYQYLIHFDKQIQSGVESVYRLISNNIKFVNSKFIPSFDATTPVKLTDRDMKIEFNSCFIDNCRITGKSIKLKQTKLKNIQIYVSETEYLEITNSTLIQGTGFIRDNPVNPITIIIKDNDLSLCDTADQIFDSSFTFPSDKIQKIVIKDNKLNEPHIEVLSSNILIPYPTKGIIREGFRQTKIWETSTVVTPDNKIRTMISQNLRFRYSDKTFYKPWNVNEPAYAIITSSDTTYGEDHIFAYIPASVTGTINWSGITGTYTKFKIPDHRLISPIDHPDGSITEAKLANNSVSTAKIQDSAITTAKIANLNVTTAKIADGNITTAKIQDGAVTTAKIADLNVTTAKIANANVTTAKIDMNGLKDDLFILNGNVPSPIVIPRSLSAKVQGIYVNTGSKTLYLKRVRYRLAATQCRLEIVSSSGGSWTSSSNEGDETTINISGKDDDLKIDIFVHNTDSENDVQLNWAGWQILGYMA